MLGGEYMNQLSKEQKIIIIVISIVVSIVIGMYIFQRLRDNNIEELNLVEINEISEEEKEVKSDIVIHVTGAVNNQGIVRLEEGARIADAIEQAGGLTEEADVSQINLAYILEDGQKIYIPTKEEVKEATELRNSLTENQNYIISESGNGVISDSKNGKNNNEKGVGKVDINKASRDELNTLPGIGDVTAERIIEYRENNGDFSKIEDLKEVSGIGEAKYEKIKEMITV